MSSPGTMEAMSFKDKDLNAATNRLISQREQLGMACFSINYDPEILFQTIEVEEEFDSYREASKNVPDTLKI